LSWLFEVDSVAKRFGGRSVLEAASLRLPAGAVTMLVGRNGCGKTTMLRIATGRLAAESGFVRFDGRTYLRPRLARLACLGLLYLPDRDLLSHAFSVRWQLELAWRSLGRGAGGVPADEAASRTGLGGLLDHRPQALSEGERRRAEFALALVRGPRCLLADEPFRHLAPPDAALVATALRDLAAAGGAVAVTGHEIQFLFDVADRVTWCTSGTTYDLGTSDAARRDRRFCAEYLGVPPETREPGGEGGGPSPRAVD
jgi:ABC-type multidrug transport system ATPase subunit